MSCVVKLVEERIQSWPSTVDIKPLEVNNELFNAYEFMVTRMPSSTLVPFFWGVRFPYKPL